MRTVPFTFGGTTYYLLLNGAALFDIYERYGSKGSVTDHIKGSGKKSFAATCWYLHKLAEQGELFRRWQGYDKGPIPSEEVFRVGLSPAEIPLAKEALEEALHLGFLREEDQERKEIDVGLLELQKKRDPADQGPVPQRRRAVFGAGAPGGGAAAGGADL